MANAHFLEKEVLRTPPKSHGWWTKPLGLAVFGIGVSLVITNNLYQENILFGSEYNEQRYQKGEIENWRFTSRWRRLRFPYVVIKQTALDTDLSMFEAGDKTEVGEKGVTLR